MDGKKITRLAVQKKNPQRVNVYLDDEFGFGIEKILAYKLHLGQVLSESEIEALSREDRAESAYRKALNFIGYRPRSEKEVSDKLRKMECSDDEISKALARLKNAGLVSDRSFSEMWVENRNEFRPRSQRMLRHELRMKGISEDIIEETLEDADDFSTAYALAQKRVRRWGALEKQEFRKKMMTYLGGKGYTYDVIRQVSEKIWSEMDDDTDSDGEIED